MPMAPFSAGKPIISAVSHILAGSRIYPSASATLTSRKRSVTRRTSVRLGSPGYGDDEVSMRVVSPGMSSDATAAVAVAMASAHTASPIDLRDIGFLLIWVGGKR